MLASMIPDRYYYLVDATTLEPLALFSADDCRFHFEVSAREAQIRVKYGVDDAESGLLLRSNASASLPIEKARAVLADMKRRGVSPFWPAPPSRLSQPR